MTDEMIRRFEKMSQKRRLVRPSPPDDSIRTSQPKKAGYYSLTHSCKDQRMASAIISSSVISSSDGGGTPPPPPPAFEESDGGGGPLRLRGEKVEEGGSFAPVVVVDAPPPVDDAGPPPGGGGGVLIRNCICCCGPFGSRNICDNCWAMAGFEAICCTAFCIMGLLATRGSLRIIF